MITLTTTGQTSSFFSKKRDSLFPLIDHPARPVGRGGWNQREPPASPYRYSSPPCAASLGTLLLLQAGGVEQLMRFGQLWFVGVCHLLVRGIGGPARNFFTYDSYVEVVFPWCVSLLFTAACICPHHHLPCAAAAGAFVCFSWRLPSNRCRYLILSAATVASRPPHLQQPSLPHVCRNRTLDLILLPGPWNLRISCSSQ